MSTQSFFDLKHPRMNGAAMHNWRKARDMVLLSFLYISTHLFTSLHMSVLPIASELKILWFVTHFSHLSVWTCMPILINELTVKQCVRLAFPFFSFVRAFDSVTDEGIIADDWEQCYYGRSFKYIISMQTRCVQYFIVKLMFQVVNWQGNTDWAINKTHQLLAGKPSFFPSNMSRPLIKKLKCCRWKITFLTRSSVCHVLFRSPMFVLNCIIL